MSPRDVASKIVQNVGPSPWVEKLDVAGAGFINITLKKSQGCKVLSHLLQKGVQPPPLTKKRRVVVDFSSPNIAKEMHVGHLRFVLLSFLIVI